MSTAIEILWRQALKTFTGRGNRGYKLCQKNFDKLHTLMNNIVADDVKVNETVLNHVKNNSTPMSVIHIYENQDIAITIFLLKNGVTLPLHDHPGMHGLLKVINGTVRIDSYSTTTGLENIKLHDKIIAHKHPPIIVKNNDDACVLTPNNNNLHEITCVEGPAAFLDILSPPYDDGIINRPCTYFKQIPFKETSPTSSNAVSSTKVELMIIQSPTNFYSTNLNYSGKPLR